MVCEEEPTLNQVYTVTDDGLILVDFIGVVEVAGLTPAEAAQRIADRLVDDRILRAATVTITILEQEIGSVTFSGAVAVTGMTPFRTGMRLSDVIAIAGPRQEANLSAIRILRRSGQMLSVDFDAESLDNERNPVLVEGDEIFVPITERPGSVAVLGGVENPGVIEMPSGMTLGQAIEAAGGLSARALPDTIRLEREGAATVVLDLGTSANYELKSGDRIVVQIAEQRRYVRIDGQVASPGFVEYTPGTTLVQAIERAGGLTRGARQDRILIERTDGTATETITVDYNRISRGYMGDVELQPGDRITVAGGRSGINPVLQVAAGIALYFLLFGR